MIRLTLLAIMSAVLLASSGCATLYPANHENEKPRVCRPGSAIRYETSVPTASPAPLGMMRLAPPHGNCLYQ